MSRSVLMVSPYWPPVNKVGVWRVLRAARYLPERGWTPIICTPKPEQVYKSPPLSDASFITPDVEVIQPDTWIPSMATARALSRPHHWLKDRDGRRGLQYVKRAASLLDRGSFRVIAEMLLPDQFVEWGWQTARRIEQQLTERGLLDEVKVVWATGGPFGFLVAGALIAEALDKPLVLDYRDPWTTHRAPRTWWIAPPRRAFRAVESWSLSRASAVGYINEEALTANRAAFGQPPNSRWAAIPNSFDSIDLGDLPPRELSQETNTPALVYAGNFYGARSALPVIKALIALDQSAEGRSCPLTLHVFGQIDPPAQELLDRSELSSDRLRCYPRHSAAEIGAIMRGASGLLLVIGEQHGHHTLVSGKVWDYLAAGRPIIGIGPASAAARELILDNGLGAWANTRDSQGIIELFASLSRGEIAPPAQSDLSRFHARHMSGAIADLLDYAETAPRLS